MAKQNITLSADTEAISLARKKAENEKTTLNNKFREWLDQYVNSSTRAERFLSFLGNLTHINSGRKFSREELNER